MAEVMINRRHQFSNNEVLSVYINEVMKRAPGAGRPSVYFLGILAQIGAL
jgi:hypothetical protein